MCHQTNQTRETSWVKRPERVLCCTSVMHTEEKKHSVLLRWDVYTHTSTETSPPARLLTTSQTELARGTLRAPPEHAQSTGARDTRSI